MSRMVDVEAKITWETEKAWKVSNDKAADVWIPKALKGEEIQCDEGEKGWAIFTLPEWFAVEKELV